MNIPVFVINGCEIQKNKFLMRISNCRDLDKFKKNWYKIYVYLHKITHKDVLYKKIVDIIGKQKKSYLITLFFLFYFNFKKYIYPRLFHMYCIINIMRTSTSRRSTLISLKFSIASLILRYVNDQARIFALVFLTAYLKE